MTKQRSIHVEHVTNHSPFDKSMIDMSEVLKGKQMLLGGKEKKARLLDCLFKMKGGGGVAKAKTYKIIIHGMNEMLS